MAVHAYCRASTAKQIASPATQKEIILRYCKLAGLDFDGSVWFVDPATSGKMPIGERPAGRRLIEVMKRGDHIVVARLDRLSRSLANFARILDTCEERGATLHICDVPGGAIDPSNPHARAYVSVIGTFAELERRMISIRTQEGLASMRAEGHVFGVPKYGFKKKRIYSRRLKKHISQIEPDEAEQKVIRKMVELRARGLSYEYIATYLNNAGIHTRDGYDWSNSTVATSVRTGLKLLASHEYSKTQEEVAEVIADAEAELRDAANRPRIEDEDPEEGEEMISA